MDNTRTLPGYKYYIDPATGARGAWFVTFLNIVPDSQATVNGVAFEISDRLLERLDERERNYTRVDISADLSRPVDGSVWAYVGTDAAVGRFREGHRAHRAVISREYHEGVQAHFAALGDDALDRFTELTDHPPCPVIDLQRVDYPPSPGPLTSLVRPGGRSQLR